MRLHRGACALTLATVLVAGGCAEEPDSDSSASSSSEATSSGSSTADASTTAPESSASGSASADPTSSGGAAPSFPADAAPTSAAGDPSSAAILTGIQVSAEDGYDRVTITFDGPGVPGYVAQYAAEASRQGQGSPIEVPGEAMLDIVISGTTYPAPDGGLAAGEIAGAAGDIVQGVFNDGTFEGQTHIVIGTSNESPYVVTVQGDPATVTVDISA